MEKVTFRLAVFFNDGSIAISKPYDSKEKCEKIDRTKFSNTKKFKIIKRTGDYDIV